jgi:hypothetical protein
MKEMSYKKFKEIVQKYLGENYNEMPYYGKWRDKDKPHILKVDGSSKSQRLAIIKDKNLIPIVKECEWPKNYKLHPNAHHLNSSQIMCYNFFRLLIEEGKLKDVLKEYCDELSEEIDKYEFEYEPDKKEGTNFDFYCRSGNVEVKCEIKYIEEAFTRKTNSKRLEAREILYKERIEKNPLFKSIDVADAINHEYQLFRNALSAGNIGKIRSYVLFICPKDRKNLEEQYLQFEEKCLNKSKFVQFVYWEDLICSAKQKGVNVDDFWKRYFGWKNDNITSHCLR